MPPKKEKVVKKNEPRKSDDDLLQPIDVQYNPDIVAGLLHELQQQMDNKCSQIQKDADFMTISIQQAFHLELIKLPTQVKNMSLTRFQEEFGDSLEAATRGAILNSQNQTKKGAATAFGSAVKSSRTKVFQTPSGSSTRVPLQGLSTSLRNPKEGEKIVSMNGSPLGDFRTVIKSKNVGNSNIMPPPTPGFVTLDSGDVIDIDTIDVNTLSKDNKEDALSKMKAMMDNIQMCMSKLGKSS
jgi:hypothetical protein